MSRHREDVHRFIGVQLSREVLSSDIQIENALDDANDMLNSLTNRMPENEEGPVLGTNTRSPGKRN